MLPERGGIAGVAKVARDRELCVPLSWLRGAGFILFCNPQPVPGCCAPWAVQTQRARLQCPYLPCSQAASSALGA